MIYILMFVKYGHFQGKSCTTVRPGTVEKLKNEVQKALQDTAPEVSRNVINNDRKI